jgi:hypothetical protein
MKKVNAYVHVYRLQFEAITENLNIIENFIESISSAAVISYESSDTLIIAACESQLSKSEIANRFIDMGMQNEYELTSIGMLGPFRECF